MNENCPYDKHKVSPAIPIKLVISEAGPTNFVERDNNGNLILPDNNTCAMAGTTINDPDLITKLTNASPLTYVTSNAPYTILAYGNGVGPFSIPGLSPLYTGPQGDGFIPHLHAETLCDSLCNNGVLHQLYTLNGVGHNDFFSLINNSSYLSMLSSVFSTLNTN